MQNRVNKRGSCSLHAVCDNSIRLCCYFAASVFHCNGSVAKGRKQKAEKARKTLSRLGIEPAFNATDVKGVLIPRISEIYPLSRNDRKMQRHFLIGRLQGRNVVSRIFYFLRKLYRALFHDFGEYKMTYFQFC